MSKQKKKKSKKKKKSPSDEIIKAQVELMVLYSRKEIKEHDPHVVEYMDSDFRGTPRMREVYRHPRADYFMGKSKFNEYYTCSSCGRSYEEKLSEFQMFQTDTLAKKKTCPNCVKTAFMFISRNFLEISRENCT
jgi:hypothetical protein